MSAWSWRERGDELTLAVPIDGGLWLKLDDDDARVSLAMTLPPRAVVELSEWIDAQLDVSSVVELVNLETELRSVEDDRDAAIARAERAEAQLARMRAAMSALEAATP